MNLKTATILEEERRAFVPREFKLTTWAKLKPYYNALLSREIGSTAELEEWIEDRSELDAVVSEAFSWRYVKITVDSKDDKAESLYQYTVQELAPKITYYEDALNRKLTECPFVHHLDQEKFHIHLRGIRNAVELFREENIPYATDIQLKAKEYVKIFSEMTIGVDGKQMTLQKASSLLEETDRAHRESVYHKIHQRILQETDHLEALFGQLLQMRHQMALNAGFSNFRDYKFRALGRFDYTVKDCYDFHDSIRSEIVPLIDEMNRFRKEALNIDQLRPWDMFVDPFGKQPLRPFEDADELVDKLIQCFDRLNPEFGHTISLMRDKGRLDLESREGKRPGAYNMPMHLSGLPFIFMNATNSLADMRILMHEGGHAVHSWLTRNYKLKSEKRVPSEVAELAAMTMELLSMEHWDIFFEDEADLRRAKIAQLEYILKVLPWIATIDEFQHWLYTNPHHNQEERKTAWMEILKSFNSTLVDHTGLEHYSEYLWHKQLHLFEVPFYYIEYGMAQLGAIAIWKQYRENPQKAVHNYYRALRLGYTKDVKTIYRTAGIDFNFSREYVSELATFVKDELEKLL
ncbi:MAG TPA: M3 family oligoendopeptidase [Saprospiraceae bacterium]|nr:M3 family oligoendopeptidase [Saprospiraceae bacterium]HMQ85866.1 M3 family oligoendopeptidase [Saprospiraceae bacterium]